MNNNKFFEKVLKAVEKFATEKHVRAIQSGMACYIPFTIVGAVATLVAAFPLPAYQNFMANTFGPLWMMDFYNLNNGMMNLASILCVVFIAYSLSKEYENENINPIHPAMISLGVFIYLTMFKSLDGADVVEVSKFGAANLIMAIILGLLVADFYRFLIKRNISIKLPESVPPMVSQPFTAAVPLGIIMICAFILKKLVGFAGFDDIHTLVYAIISTPMMGFAGNLFGYTFTLAVCVSLWFFGIHGSSIFSAIMGPVTIMMTDANRLAFLAGQPLPHIITNEYWLYISNYSALAQVIAIMLVCKSVRLRQVAKVGFAPSLFTITEPMTFGIPTVFNPYMLVPQFLVPIVGSVTTYIMMATNIVPRLCGAAIPWSTPMGIFGFLATGNSIIGALWQFVLLACYVLINIPFLKAYDKSLLAKEQSGE